jgi:hypothetical protein
VSNTRKATGPKRLPGSREDRRAADQIALALVRAYRTGDTDEARRLAVRAPATAGSTVVAVLAAVVAGLTADVADEHLEGAVAAGMLRGMQRPGKDETSR